MWWRRRFPLGVTAIAGVLYLVSQVLLPLGFGLLTIAIQRRDRVLVGASAVVALLLMVPDVNSPSSPTFDFGTVVTGVLGALFWALWGAYVGARRDLVASLRERAIRAEEERERRADQARLAERARIAREMHDVLAHKVSLIALQAGGLEVNPGIGAERVQQTAGQIRSAAREALEELRGVLGVLRADQPAPASSDGSELAPQPGLAELTALVESSRAAGVRISQTIEVTELPNAAGRAVYRVVQESLTNVHKHARGAATDVAVSAVDGGVLVTVSNQRPVAAGSLLPGSGAGLIGLRERVALLGGTLTAGPTGDGGWRVQAWLPGGAQAAPAHQDGTAAWLAS
jgi:signal transduction histidine kinase